MMLPDIIARLPIPQQRQGTELLAESRRKADNAGEAEQMLSIVRKRLQDINNWHQLSGKALARFQLFRHDGQREAQTPEPGMYIRIDIPGPGSIAGEGYDWVKITDRSDFSYPEGSGSYIVVQPAPKPGSGKENPAHFYSGDSSSIFLVFASGADIHAMVLDRNLEMNNDTGSAADNVRNSLVAGAGMLAFSKLQWQMLTDGLIADS